MIKKYFLLFLFSAILGTVLGFPNFFESVEAANANLFVSAENSQFNNYFAGAMVIEVLISDPDISKKDALQSEPDVTVNGKNLRMVQATDGNWYGYFADIQMAQIADATVKGDGKGLDFGKFCGNKSDFGTLFSETVAIAVPRNTDGGTDGTESIQNCKNSLSDKQILNHVVRESKSINLEPYPEVGIDKITWHIVPGQIGLDPLAWPIIQLYDFVQDGNVVVQYNKGGSTQKVTLTFASVSQYTELLIDKTTYQPNSLVEILLNDIQLNIDPTDEDSWSWSTAIGNEGIFYQLFDEDGNSDADGTQGTANLLKNLNNLMFEGNGIIKLNPITQVPNPYVVSSEINQNQRIVVEGDIKQTRTEGGTLGRGSQPITFIESDETSGIFRNWDKFGKPNLIISSTAKGGTTATIEYNKIIRDILVESSNGFEPEHILLSVYTDKENYNYGEIISISGFAEPSLLSKAGFNVNPNSVQLKDSLGNKLNSVALQQQILISADVSNLKNDKQSFAYILRIEKENVGYEAIAWITGSLDPGQAFSPALSWIPEAQGTYTATIFVWDGINSAKALTSPITMRINVGVQGSPDLSSHYIPLENEPVTLKIINSKGNIILIDQFHPESDGEYVRQYLAKGKLWNKFGEQDIVMVQQGGQENSTTFSVATENTQPPPPPQVCGDGVVNQPSEQCEPPNTNTCDASCKIVKPFCGDGVVNQPSEQCEPPNTKTCDTSCNIVIIPPETPWWAYVVIIIIGGGGGGYSLYKILGVHVEFKGGLG